MSADRYDIIIIGSGAGGGTMARALSATDAQILIVERGGFVPQEAENWSPEAVWGDLRYRTRERWLDEQIMFDSECERQVSRMILKTLSSLLGQRLETVQQLNRLRKTLIAA